MEIWTGTAPKTSETLPERSRLSSLNIYLHVLMLIYALVCQNSSIQANRIVFVLWNITAVTHEDGLVLVTLTVSRK